MDKLVTYEERVYPRLYEAVILTISAVPGDGHFRKGIVAAALVADVADDGQSKRMISSNYCIYVYKNNELYTSFLLAVEISMRYSPNVLRSMLHAGGEEPCLPKDLDDKIAELIASAIYETMKKADDPKSVFRIDCHKERAK